MKKVRYFFIVFLLFLVAFWWLFPHVLSCSLIHQNSNFVEIEPNVFVSIDTSPKASKQLKDNIRMAKARVEHFWGKQKGNASIIYCNKASLYEGLCNTTEGAGCSVGSPFGTWIILNYDGLNTDVISHEMCHDELLERLGWRKTKQQIPTWFDEGLALQLDDRFGSNHDSIQRYIDYKTELRLINAPSIPLNDLAANKAFFSSDRFITKIAYLTAAMEVSHKIAKEGKQKINKIVEQMTNGEEFRNTYFKTAKY